MTRLDVKESATGSTLRVWAKPRASTSRVKGVRDGALEVALAAPPVEGEANRELVRTLAHYFGLPKNAVSIVSGAGARSKLVHLEGLRPEELAERVDE